MQVAGLTRQVAGGRRAGGRRTDGILRVGHLWILRLKGHRTDHSDFGGTLYGRVVNFFRRRRLGPSREGRQRDKRTSTESVGDVSTASSQLTLVMVFLESLAAPSTGGTDEGGTTVALLRVLYR